MSRRTRAFGTFGLFFLAAALAMVIQREWQWAVLTAVGLVLLTASLSDWADQWEWGPAARGAAGVLMPLAGIAGPLALFAVAVQRRGWLTPPVGLAVAGLVVWWVLVRLLDEWWLASLRTLRLQLLLLGLLGPIALCWSLVDRYGGLPAWWALALVAAMTLSWLPVVWKPGSALASFAGMVALCWTVLDRFSGLSPMGQHAVLAWFVPALVVLLILLHTDYDLDLFLHVLGHVGAIALIATALTIKVHFGWMWRLLAMAGGSIGTVVLLRFVWSDLEYPMHRVSKAALRAIGPVGLLGSVVLMVLPSWQSQTIAVAGTFAVWTLLTCPTFKTYSTYKNPLPQPVLRLLGSVSLVLAFAGSYFHFVWNREAIWFYGLAAAWVAITCLGLPAKMSTYWLRAIGPLSVVLAVLNILRWPWDRQLVGAGAAGAVWIPLDWLWNRIFTPRPEKLEATRNVQGLIRALSFRDGQIRERAAVGLGRLGDARAIEPLIVRLSDSSSRVQLETLRALGCLGDKGISGDVARCLKDGDSDVRKVAASVLEKLGGAAAVEGLIANLSHASMSSRRESAEALVSLYRSGRLDGASKKLVLAQQGTITRRHTDNPHHPVHMDNGRRSHYDNNHSSDCGGHSDNWSKSHDHSDRNSTTHQDSGIGIEFKTE